MIEDLIEVQAKLKYARVSAQKARLVVNQICGLIIDKAFDVLCFSKKRVSILIEDILTSAIASAEHNNGMNIDRLYISTAYVNEGPTMKRFEARAKGRGNRILKRTSHITIKVAEKAKDQDGSEG